jgi:Carbohydrate family 9 binding domain-like
MFYRIPANLNKLPSRKNQSLMKLVCGIVIFGCAMQSIFGLPVREKNKVRSAKAPAIFEREVLVSPVNGVKSGLRVYYRVEAGKALPAKKSKGFQIGLRPTGNWYDGSFIHKITINNQRVKLLKSKYPKVIKIIENSDKRTILASLFETDFGDIAIKLIYLKDKLYGYLRFEIKNPKVKIANVVITLLNFPGHFGTYSKATLNRAVVIADKNIEISTEPQNILSSQGWVFYYDKNSNFYGSSALMYRPREIESLMLKSDSKKYGLQTIITLKKGGKSCNLLLWEFSKKKFSQAVALDYMKTTAAGLQKELNILSTKPLKPVIKPQRSTVLYKMTKAKEAIKIDGKADDACWEVAPWADKFYYLGSAKKAQPGTKFKFAYDDKKFYFYIRCEEPDIQQVKATITQRDGAVYNDNDAVEIFLCPYGEYDNYFHYIINSRGTVWDAKINKGYVDKSWNSKINVVTEKGKDFWVAEGEILISDLVKADKKTMTVWLANVSRQRLASATSNNKYLKWSSWSKLFERKFDNPGSFNVLSGFNAPFVEGSGTFLKADNYNNLFLQDQTIECFFPRDELFIANNVAAPNYINIKDIRTKYAKYLGKSSAAQRKTKEWQDYIDNLKIFVKLPAGYSLYTGETGFVAFFSVKKEHDFYVISPLRQPDQNIFKMARVHAKFDQFMLYAKTDLPAGSRGKLKIWIEQTIQGKTLKTKVKSYPFKVVTFPKVKPLKKFSISMWANRYAFVEPDYVITRKKLGFTTIDLKITWIERNAGNEKIKSYLLDAVKQARSEKMKIAVHDSTFSRLYFSKEGRWGKKNRKSPDPTYTGAAYQSDLAAVAYLAKTFKPDYLFIDCEYYNHTVKRKIIDSWPAGKAKIQKSGLSEKDFFSRCGDRMANDVRKALKRGWPAGEVKVGFYGTGHHFLRNKFPGEEMFDGVFNIRSLLNKKLVDFVQPSPYHNGDMDVIINNLQAIRKKLKGSDGKVLTWACAGYPTPFKSTMVRDQLLEIASLGGIGVVYWGEQAWDVGAYLNQVYAINEIAPVEDIIMDGKFYEQHKKQHATAYIKGMIKDNEAVILLSCYKRYKNIKVAIKNPLNIDCAVYDISNNKKLADIKKGAAIVVELDKIRDTKMLYFGNAWSQRVNK